MLANLPIVEIIPKLIYPRIPVDIQGTHDFPLEYSDRARVKKLYFSFLFELFSERDWYNRKLALFVAIFIAILGFTNPYLLLHVFVGGIQGLNILTANAFLVWFVFFASTAAIWFRPKPRVSGVRKRIDWALVWRYRPRKIRAALKILLTVINISLFVRAVLIIEGTGQGIIASLFFGSVTGILAAIAFLIYAILRYRTDNRFQNPLSEDDYKESEAVIFDMELYQPPEGTPEDLRDIYRGSIQAASGLPRNSRVDLRDFGHGQIVKQGTFTLLHIAALACGVGVFFGANLLLIIPLATITGISLLFDVSPFYDRAARRKTDPVKRNEHLYRSNGGLIWGKSMEGKRKAQWVEAKRDQSPIIDLAVTTGFAHNRQDPMAPNPNLKISMSLKDMLTHTIVFGKTGGGKTAGFARVALSQLRDVDNLGILVMDGKGTLPAEVAPYISGYKLLDPKNGEPVSLLGELDASEVGYLFASLFGKKQEGGNAEFFKQNATTMISNAVALARFCAKHQIYAPPWQLTEDGIMPVAKPSSGEEPSRLAIGTDISFGDQTIREVSLYDIIMVVEDIDLALSLAMEAWDYWIEEGGTEEEKRALRYFTKELPAMHSETRKNIQTSTKTWFAGLLGHEDLMAWLKATPSMEKNHDGVDIRTLLHGARFGLNVPEYRYGDAGKAISNMIKTRIQKMIKARGDDPDWQEKGETPVIALIDEVQEVLTEKDAEILQIGRSLGYGLIALTQTIENIEHRMPSQTAARAFLDIFSSYVCFDTLSERTAQLVVSKLNGYMQERVTTIPADDPLADFRIQSQMENSLLVSSSMTANVDAHEPLFDKMVQGLAKKLGLFKNRRLNPVLTSTIQPLKFVDPHELTGLLGGIELDNGEQFILALYAINRAGQQRADIGMAKPIYGLS